MERSTASILDKTGWKNGKIDLPVGVRAVAIAYSPSGLYYVCSQDHVIYSIDKAGKTVRFAGIPGASGKKNGKLAEATFNFHPSAALHFRDADILVADCGSHQIRLIIGSRVSTFAGTVSGRKDGPREQCQFFRPSSIEELNGVIYICDSHNHLIRLITPDGMVRSIGAGIEGLADGSFNICQFARPYHITVSEKRDSLIVSDYLNNRIRLIDLTNQAVSTLTEIPRPGRVVLASGDLLVASYDSHCIIQIDSTGFATTIITNNTKSPWDMCLSPERGQLAWISYLQPSIHVMSDFCEPSYHTPPVDLSFLLTSGYGSDLQLCNEHTGRTFHLHTQVLGLSSALLTTSAKAVISTLQMPSIALTAFFETLYGRSPLHYPAALPLSIGIALAYVIHISDLVRLESVLLECALGSVLPKLSPPELCRLLLEIWINCDRNNRLLELVSAHLRPDAYHFTSQASEWRSVAVLDIERYTRLVQQLNDSSELHRPPTSPPRQTALQRGLEGMSERIRLRKADQPAAPDTDFCFMIAERTICLDVHSWVLYPQWAWFRQLMDSGMEEKETRQCILPPEFPAKLLLSIVKFLYSASHLHFQAITEADCGFVIARAGEFGFVDSTLHPQPPFEPLLAVISKHLHEPLNPSNCLQMILTRQALGTKRDADEAIEYAARHFDVAVLSPGAATTLQHLPDSTVSYIVRRFADLHSAPIENDAPT